ncbi:MAG: glycosyltransferase, partial [Patescibacteria group bacterium]|nr:glycosyltransferase [Patescibacteria group bacterium]
MSNKIKRIGIDARFYGPLGKGLGRYTQEIVDNIIKLDRDNEYVIFLRRENFNDFKNNNPKVKKVLADIGWYTLTEQILLPYYIWREQPDLMHFPHFNVPIFCPVKFIVTIHDLILIKFPTLRATTLGPVIYKIKNLAYRFVISSAVKRAKKVLAVSDYTKQTIVEQFKIASDKVIVTYEGVAELTKAPFNKGGGGDLISQPYLLYVGNAYPHKNLEGLIKVFSEI